MNKRIINLIFSWLLTISTFAQQSWMELSIKAYENKEYSKSIEYAQKAMGNGGNKDVCCYAIARCYHELEEFQKAIEYYQMAMDNGWDKGQCYNNIADCCSWLKKYTKTIEYSQRALDYGYNKGKCYLRIANGYDGLMEYSVAVDYYKKAMDSGEDKSVCYTSIAFCYKKLKEHMKAFDFFIKASEHNFPVSYGWIGEYYYYGRGTSINYAKAYEYFKKSADANIHRGYLGLARCTFEGKGTTQNKTEAYRLVEKSIELARKIGSAENQAQSIAYKGEMLSKDGKTKEAEMLWKEISQLDENYATTSEDYFCQMMRGGGADGVDVGMDIASVKNNETFAIIISNENYKREESVPFAINDGKIFYEYCTKTLGLPEKNVKFMEDATINDMKYAVGWIEKIGDAFGGDAKLIVYYSGHGIPDEKGTSAYLLPVDGYGTDVSTGYKLTDLYASLNSASAKSVTVFLDACFSGTKRDGSMLASARGVAIKTKQETPSGNMLVLSAAQGDETAYPYNEKRHGLFTYYLLKKLKETKGNATLGELSDYVIKEVKKTSIVENEKIQTPTVTVSPTFTNWKNLKLK